jgi:hypothetical protein
MINVVVKEWEIACRDYFKVLSRYSEWNEDSFENQEQRCSTKIPNGISPNIIE